MENSKTAKEYFKSGYNCAQAVFLTYATRFGFERDMALKLASSFGGGMGRLREVCGAVVAMFMIVGLESGYVENNNDKLKAEHYSLIQKLAQEFKDKHNTIICRELLKLGSKKQDSPIPEKRTDEYYKVRPCEVYIEDVCKILDNYFETKKAI